MKIKKSDVFLEEFLEKRVQCANFRNSPINRVSDESVPFVKGENYKTQSDTNIIYYFEN